MFLIIGFVSLVVVPVLVNKTTEIHFNWLVPYLRQIWCGVALVYAIYFLTTDTGKQLLIDFQSSYGSKHPILTIGLSMLAGAILAPSYWWLMGKLVPVASRSRQSRSKLAIHAADYAAFDGSGTVYDVTEFMQKIITGNSLVFDIENHNFVAEGKNYVPTDPMFGVLKRLRVKYSYDGHDAITIERQEHSRIVLPEDSVVVYLRTKLMNNNSDLAQSLQQRESEIARLKDEIGRLKLQHEAEEFRSRQIRDETLAELRTVKQRAAKLDLDWRAEWEDMERKFRALAGQDILADQSDVNDPWAWEIRSDTGSPKLKECQALCELAGSKLLASVPAITVSLVVRSSEPSWKRWLEFIKEAQGLTHTYSINGVIQGKRVNSQAGQIRNLPDAAAVACIACAATTYPRQQSE